MLTKERVFELMKEAGLDEKKYLDLLAKEAPDLMDKELDDVNGGLSTGAALMESEKKSNCKETVTNYV